ncbi:MAG TPA: phenylalanine--tRNA ligase subunit beta [Stellaceae bacterium]|jgi:phenylalanyl-tRNA synthetase beta chain
MKTTLGWLKTHLETDAPLDTIVQHLVMLGLEVESIENRAKDLAGFVIGRVVDARPHPNADRLKLLKVDAGKGEVEVVCGAPNARAGLTGVFAAPGVTIPRNGMVLKVGEIRGVKSNGMMCSGYELKLSEDHEGIIELSDELKPGANFASALGLDDPVIDIKITPNRADCLGVRGLARDLAAAGLGTLKPLDSAPVVGAFESPIKIRLEGPDAKACPLFLGRLIRGVKNGPSPRWLQDRLTAIGLRPISALVDVTNFMTYDLDRPLHVFDAEKLAGDLTLRGARDGEQLAALNGKSYALDSEMTAIADRTGALSLGGVIGGESTACSEATTSVFIEAALFDPVRTAATGRKLGITSDARYRFERGIDPEFTAAGMEIATRLILDICGGGPSNVAAAGAVPDWRRRYHLRANRVETLGGVTVSAPDQRRILADLGCKVENDGDGFAVEPPSWRADIEGEADLVEEILRIRGFDEIPALPLARDFVLPKPALSGAQRRASLVRRSLASRGLVEAVTFSFLPKAQAALFGGGSEALTLANPISADLDQMRPSILPNLLAAAQRNADRGSPNGALFEIGPIYKDDTPEGQVAAATGLRTGSTTVKRWDDPGRPVDALIAKADALAALIAAGVAAESLQVTADAPGWYHPGRGAVLRQGTKPLAQFGEIHPGILTAMGVAGPAVGFEVFLDAVPAPRARAGKARPLLQLSSFQPVERDFAFVVDEGVAAETLLRAARGVDRKLVADVRLFDVYRGKGVDPGKKSLAVTVVLQPVEATLTDEAIEAFSQKLIAAVEKAAGGTLRR